MGLTDLNAEQFAKLKELVELLGVFGISEDDLRYLPEALKVVKSLNSLNYKAVELSKDEKSKIEEKNKRVMTPEEYFEQFRTDDLEGL